VRPVGSDPRTTWRWSCERLGIAIRSSRRSSTLKVGQLVIAIGNRWVQSSVSTGVVSATGRAMRSLDRRLIENVVQHTAPLNPGNSGGPLVDSRGRVVGSTRRSSRPPRDRFFGASNTASHVVSQILAYGKSAGIPRSHWMAKKLSRRRVRYFDLPRESGWKWLPSIPAGRRVSPVSRRATSWWDERSSGGKRRRPPPPPVEVAVRAWRASMCSGNGEDGFGVEIGEAAA